MLEVGAAVEEGGGGGGELEELVLVEEGGGGGGGLEELAAVSEGVADALDTLPPPSPLSYGGRRGKAAKENLEAPASQHAVPPDNSGRLESQQ